VTDLAPWAADLGCEAAALRAVVAVESAGRGRGPDGRATIRLEVHHLWRRAANKAAIDERFRVKGPKPWEGHEFLYYTGNTGGSREWRAMHTGQALEWVAYVCASTLDPDAACRATSWGVGQVLGDWTRLGFASVADFEAAQTTEAGQLDTMVRFIRADPVLVNALRNRDFVSFAGRYNGTGKTADYSAKLAAAYRLA
jgi:hypothetical protein